MKKAMKTKKKSAVKKSTPRKSARAKTAKKKAAPKAKLASARKKTKSPRRAGNGLSVAELYQLKQNQEHPVSGTDWQHKKALPPQDQHSKDEMRAKGASNRRSGFGGVRHH